MGRDGLTGQGEASGLSRAAGIPAPTPAARRLQPGHQPVCVHCRRPAERVDSEWACRTCRKKPVITIHAPGQVIVVEERLWT